MLYTIKKAFRAVGDKFRDLCNFCSSVFTAIGNKISSAATFIGKKISIITTPILTKIKNKIGYIPAGHRPVSEILTEGKEDRSHFLKEMYKQHFLKKYCEADLQEQIQDNIAGCSKVVESSNSIIRKARTIKNVAISESQIEKDLTISPTLRASVTEGNKLVMQNGGETAYQKYLEERKQRYAKDPEAEQRNIAAKEQFKKELQIVIEQNRELAPLQQIENLKRILLILAKNNIPDVMQNHIRGHIDMLEDTASQLKERVQRGSVSLYKTAELQYAVEDSYQCIKDCSHGWTKESVKDMRVLFKSVHEDHANKTSSIVAKVKSSAQQKYLSAAMKLGEVVLSQQDLTTAVISKAVVEANKIMKSEAASSAKRSVRTALVAGVQIVKNIWKSSNFCVGAALPPDPRHVSPKASVAKNGYFKLVDPEKSAPKKSVSVVAQKKTKKDPCEVPLLARKSRSSH